MAQTQRNEAIKRVESGKMHVLIATDVASRGLILEGYYLLPLTS